MVGPSLTPEERDVANLRLKVGFVVLVAVSAGLVAVQARASLAGVGVALVGGTLLGLVLLWFLVRWGREFRASGPSGPRR
jgi:hypothetical protein